MKRATVGDYMTVNVVTLRPEDGFKEIVRALAERGVSGAPVVDADGRVLGVVSEADILHKEEFKTASQESRHYFESRRHRAARAKAAGNTAAELMNAPAMTVPADTPLVMAARAMAQHGVKRLPVVRPDGTLAGIISRGDVMGVFLTPDREIRDEIISEVITRALGEDPERIEVDVHGGTVTLRGTVERKSHIPLAIALTRAIDGVVEVVGDDLSFTTDDTSPGGLGYRQ
ncbi:CBS domain-containing protein [Spongiactinospora sp. TRM90649]|uniref:CBS domain-containing protein n=1 Tax=Spongiactinospora sp. TRM90649 TaxID=3031114 RepID=UPI0023F9EE48|nr:CBS domain-containing protein [Spongiactinospora sp. TRM90649]MDF5756296.1 CBS domain-containing protein [Spongiactinospora sp. TRM90649]